MTSGLLITLEGIDFCGKSTQAELLARRLRETGVRVVTLRDPGGTKISERIREILLDPELREMHPTTELLLYEAARAQMVAEQIEPALKEGAVVLCDRYYDSTTAYQGYGRNLPLDDVRIVNRIASLGRRPDLTFVIDISVEESLRREQKLGTRSDRMEAERPQFRQKVRDGYLQLAREEKDRVVLVDGSQGIDTVHEKIWQFVEREAKNRGIL